MRILDMKTKILASFVAALTVTAAFAHSGASGIVMERMEMMKNISTHMKTVALIVRGDQDFDSGKAVTAAQAIAAHADELPGKFPAGSLDHPSEALPAIWENWDQFVGLAQQLQANAMALSEAAETAESADMLQDEFAALGQTCSSCHQNFRKAN
jgi:cytochrome c556